MAKEILGVIKHQWNDNYLTIYFVRICYIYLISFTVLVTNDLCFIITDTEPLTASGFQPIRSVLSRLCPIRFDGALFKRSLSCYLLKSVFTELLANILLVGVD